MGNENRKRQTILTIRCTPEEADIIRKSAKATTGSVSSYLRNIGLGYKLNSNLDKKVFLELSNHFGDLGRIGGLLRMWLTNKERVTPESIKRVSGALSSICEIKEDIKMKLKKL